MSSCFSEMGVVVRNRFRYYLASGKARWSQMSVALVRQASKQNTAFGLVLMGPPRGNNLPIRKQGASDSTPEQILAHLFEHKESLLYGRSYHLDPQLEQALEFFPSM